MDFETYFVKEAKKIGLEITKENVIIQNEKNTVYLIKLNGVLLTTVKTLKQIEDIILVHKALQRKKKCS